MFIMKSLKWILFIPVSILAYLIGIVLFAFVWNLIPSKEENPLLNKYIMPSIINIVGIIIYFFIGQAILSEQKEKTNQKVNLALSIIIITIQCVFLYFSFVSDEYNKIISSIVGCIVGILALFDSIKKHKI